MKNPHPPSTPGAKIEAALTHHQSGRLGEAEAIYRQVLADDPANFDALHLLGVIANQSGNSEQAARLIGLALQQQPEHPFALNNLGLALQSQGKPDAAISCYRKAISAKPDFADAHYNLGNLLQIQNKPDEAANSYRQALALHPDDADALNNLGGALRSLGRLNEAVDSYRKAVSIRPDFAEAFNNLGVAFHEQGETDQAISSLTKAVSLRPNYAEGYMNLGNALQTHGRFDEALASYRRVLLLKPDMAEAYIAIGNTLRKQDKMDEAAAGYRRALSLKPDFAEAHNNLGIVLQTQDKLDEAIASYRQAISLKPDYAEAYNNLGNTLRDQGKPDAATENYRRALSFKPDYAMAYSNLLFLHGYHASLPPHEYLILARGWEQACVPGLDRQLAHDRSFSRLPLAGRRLRVGYVSGDYRQHAVSYFIEQLFAQHDKASIELFAYSNSSVRDAVTERLQALADHWIPIAGVTDAAIRDRIEADGIDVLIDLSGHTEHNCLGAFALRAAPVQAHYLGYFASTGLTEMDYFIGDKILTPPETDSHFSEQVWRLPRVRASYDGKADAPPPDSHPAQDGSVWVGSFNSLGKLTPATLALWAKVLRVLPEGRLLLKTKELADVGNRRRILDAVAAYGIPPDRVELRDSTTTPGWREHMAYYKRLDIALDPVGAHGGYTTTCDALWMGAPVITLEGDRMASRMTASILDAIGHPEWVAHSEAEYVDKVVALARNAGQRKALRSAQRERMANSPLCNAKDLATNLEHAYIGMFERRMGKQTNELS